MIAGAPIRKQTVGKDEALQPRIPPTPSKGCLEATGLVADPCDMLILILHLYRLINHSKYRMLYGPSASKTIRVSLM